MQEKDVKPQGKQVCGWQEIEHLVKEIATAITKGGIVPARLLSRQLRIDAIQLIAMRNKTVIK